MKKIVIILAFVLPFVFTAEGSHRYLDIRTDTISVSERYPLRTVLLYPANGDNKGIISADLIFEDNVYKLAYNGRKYTFSSIKGTAFDSSVKIDDQEYVFRVKPRSYE